MNKTNVTINITSITWSRFKRLYPRQISRMVDRYLSNLVNYNLKDDKEIRKKEEVEKKIKGCHKMIEKIQIRLEKLNFEMEKIHLKEDEEAEKRRLKDIEAIKKFKAFRRARV